MTGALIRSTVIPKAEGRAFEMRAGQVLRVTAIEGKQVGGAVDRQVAGIQLAAVAQGGAQVIAQAAGVDVEGLVEQLIDRQRTQGVVFRCVQTLHTKRLLMSWQQQKPTQEKLLYRPPALEVSGMRWLQALRRQRALN